MKVRNYEKKEGIFFLIGLNILLEFIAILTFTIKKEYNYQILSGIVVKENRIMIICNKEERNLLYKNEKVFIKGKAFKYKIEEDRGIIIKKENKNYYEILLKLKMDSSYKPQDTLELSIKCKKERVIKIIKLIWEGD